MNLKKTLTFIICNVLFCLGLNAQNEKWFGHDGKLLPHYLDDNGLLAEEYRPDAYEFTSIEEAIVNPERVIKLNLSEKNLTEIPPEVFLFSNIQVLDLWNNSLTEIPEDISQLTNLQYLSLNENKITKLPSSIGELKNLLMLNLGQNLLESLPEEVS